MSFPIIINSTNRVNNNTYTVNLASTINLNDFAVSVGQAYIYYSWYNINANPLNNNRFNLTVPTSSTSLNLSITIPDGAYNIADLNNFLQYYLISQGLYITNNTTGVNTYYASFSISPTSYAVQFTTTPLPTSLPSGFTSGGMTFPASANQHYQIGILATNNFNDIIGFNVGTYPTSATNVGVQTKSSDFTPNVNPVSAVQMRLSCVYNSFSSNSQLIHVFTNGDASIGQLINASPIELQYVPCNGSHRDVTLQFFDQNGNALNILDPNIIVKLVFKKNN